MSSCCSTSWVKSFGSAVVVGFRLLPKDLSLMSSITATIVVMSDACGAMRPTISGFVKSPCSRRTQFKISFILTPLPPCTNNPSQHSIASVVLVATVDKKSLPACDPPTHLERIDPLTALCWARAALRRSYTLQWRHCFLV